MGIRINNSSFKLNNSTFKGGDVQSSSVSQLGSIYRVVNYKENPDSLSYTKIDGTVASTGNIVSSSVVYILAVSGSFSDSVNQGALGQLAITDLLITSSVNETPTFTEELITTTGAGTWTKPLGVTEVIVECWGGGGAGGGATQNSQAGSGGAGGGFARKLIRYAAAQSGKSYSVAASVAGTTGNGATGNDTTWETNLVVAKGGGGGAANDLLTGTGQGIAGTANIGDITRQGFNGGIAATTRAGDSAGGGGAAAGSAGDIEYNVGVTELGGAFQNNFPNAVGGESNGVDGYNYGGGGTGGYRTSTPSKSGGGGAQGLIRLIYR